MRTTVLAGLAALAVAGCGTTRDERIDTTQSYPDLGTGNVPQETSGELVVRTEESTWAEPGGQQERGRSSWGPELLIYDEQGRLLRRERASAVHLPAGRYLVKVKDVQAHPSVFWITVLPDKETRVDLRKEREGTLETK